ncbi:sulfite exporter TauE/SafE family protein [Rhodobacteraceae bacterium NNCM2]|nr:sulfite exporter TauE/SafE family protein [Coraliihabitans acroporae]
MTFDLITILFILTGAGLAAFVAGFAGFGTALMASGLYFHVLPAELVPPLVVIGSVVSHLTTIAVSRSWADWRPAFPFLVTGAIGVPFGVAALAYISPEALRAVVGVVLVAYGVASFSGLLKPLGTWLRSRWRDAGIGAIGGVLGGLAGLSGAVPMVWLQLAAAGPRESRAILQAYNLFLLGLAGVMMAASGLVTRDVLYALAVAVPASVAGAVLGNKAFGLVDPATFRRVVLGLLLASGIVLVWRVLA